MRIRIVPSLVAAVVLTAAIAPALAERHPEHMIALGYQTEHADVVALARAGAEAVDEDAGTITASFEVEQAIRGDAVSGARLTVVRRDVGHGTSWTDGDLYLVFLRAAPDGRYESLSGVFGIRPVTAGTPSARFPAIAGRIAATLGDGAEVTDPDTLRTLLARWATDRDDGIAASAALDLVRHEELLPGLDDEQRFALVQSFRKRSPGRARRQIALAAAAGRHIDAASALVDGLLEPGARADRGGLADALSRLGDPRAEDRILTRLAPSNAEQRSNLLTALGRIGGDRSVNAIQALLEDADPGVRVEAAHALGNVARNIHRASPGEPVSGRAELIALLDAAEAKEGAKNEVRAAIWALAQLDDPQAFDALRTIAASTERSAAVRAYAKRILERPRVMLVLD